MKREEIKAALSFNHTQQIIWMWKLRNAILDKQQRPNRDDRYIDECNETVDMLELENDDLTYMLRGD